MSRQPFTLLEYNRELPPSSSPKKSQSPGNDRRLGWQVAVRPRADLRVRASGLGENFGVDNGCRGHVIAPPSKEKRAECLHSNTGLGVSDNSGPQLRQSCIKHDHWYPYLHSVLPSPTAFAHRASRRRRSSLIESEWKLSNKSDEMRKSVRKELEVQDERLQNLLELKERASTCLKVGDFDGAVHHGLIALRYAHRWFGKGDAETIYVYLLLGEAYTHLGMWNQAEEALTSAKTLIDQSSGCLPNYDAYVIHCYNDLAYLSRLQGKVQKAVKLYQTVLQVRTRLAKDCGKEEGLSRAYNNMGLVLMSLGQYAAALEMFTAALKAAELEFHRSVAKLPSSPPPEVTDHSIPALTPSRRSSATPSRILAYRASPRGSTTIKPASQFREALQGSQRTAERSNGGEGDSLLQALAETGDLSGVDCRSRALELATIHNNIGNIYMHIGRYLEALSSYEKGKSLMEEYSFVDHPDMATCLNNIGMVYLEIGEYDEAVKRFQQALTLRQCIWGEHHIKTSACYMWLGMAALFQRRYKRALEMFNRALRIRFSLVGERDMDTLLCYNQVANVYLCEGRMSEALELYRRTREICVSLYGENDPQVQHCDENIANVHFLRGESHEALRLFMQIARMREKVHGENHPAAAAMYNNVANVLRQQGRDDEALALYEKTLAVFEDSYGMEDRYTATIYNNIGHVYCDRNDYEGALRYYLHARAIRRRLLGDNHPETCTCELNLVVVYLELGHYRICSDMLKRLEKVFSRVLGRDSPEATLVRQKQALLIRQQAMEKRIQKKAPIAAIGKEFTPRRSVVRKSPARSSAGNTFML